VFSSSDTDGWAVTAREAARNAATLYQAMLRHGVQPAARTCDVTELGSARVIARHERARQDSHFNLPQPSQLATRISKLADSTATTCSRAAPPQSDEPGGPINSGSPRSRLALKDNSRFPPDIPSM